MGTRLYTLGTLASLKSGDIPRLGELGITTISDLLAYAPIRHAQLIRAAANGTLRKDEVLMYVDGSIHDKTLDDILKSKAALMKGVGNPDAAVLKDLGASTIADLADYPPFAEAEDVMARINADDEDRDPFAPTCVLPTCKKFTRSSKNFVSFFRHVDVRNLSITMSGRSASPLAELFLFRAGDTPVIDLGYSVSFQQEWIYTGIHLGEPQGSVNLFMGQDTQVSVLDWRRSIMALRQESTNVAERLTSTLFHQRALDEVARATADEHQHGSTSSFAANAATSGSFTAAGAIVGGVGGGITGALAGLSVDALTGFSDLGLGTISGTVAGTAIGSVAGSAAASLVFSGATALGFVDTTADGARDVLGSSSQAIQQRTSQNSSSIRSFWSRIVTQNVEDEQQRIQTDRVTNYNKIHALNAIYFEVLNGYRVTIAATSCAPILFLPFLPITFTETSLIQWWWIIRTVLNDHSLVLALDRYFLTLRPPGNPSSNPHSPPDPSDIPHIGDMKASVEVSVNLDGSALSSFISDSVLVAVASALLTPFGGLAAVVGILLNELYGAVKREKVTVSVITSGGTVELERTDSANGDPNFIGTYKSQGAVAVHEIEKIQITNQDEFTIGIPNLLSIDVGQLSFDGITARITLKDRSLANFLTNIGALESEQTVRSRSFTIKSGKSQSFEWNIGDQLQDQFGPIDDARKAAANRLTMQAKIDALVGFLNANQFAFTRLILQSVEREQVSASLERIQLGGLPLSAVANTVPIGFSGNQILLPLKSAKLKGLANDPRGVDTSQLELLLAQWADIDRKDPKAVQEYLRELLDGLTAFLTAAGNASNGSPREGKLIADVTALKGMVDTRAGSAPSAWSRIFRSKSDAVAKPVVARVLDPRIDAAIESLLISLQTPIRTNGAELQVLATYFESTLSAFSDRKDIILHTQELSLPSPAVFMEPVLSNAKGAELYDMRRNSHYEILSGPGIGTTDPNVLRSNDVTLTPAGPNATLAIQRPPDLPLPNSLSAALAEVGKLNLSGLISSNATTLGGTLSNLSTVASELAKASSQLSGDAQKQALSSATDVAKQVGDLLGKAVQIPPAPPSGQQEKAETDRELRRIDKGDGTQAQKVEQKKTLGAPVAPETKLNYQMAISFLDDNDQFYPEVGFTLSLFFFETGQDVDINGGDTVSAVRGQFTFPETLLLTKGRKATIRISSEIEDVAVNASATFTLPEGPDIKFDCKLQSQKIMVSDTSVKSAVDHVVTSGAVDFSLQPMFESFLNAGVEFPFKIAKLKADTGGKQSLNLRFGVDPWAETTS